MNFQFSAVYTLLFVSAIISSFIGLNTALKNYEASQTFKAEAYEIISAINLADYFDYYSAQVNLSSNMTVKVSEDIVSFSRKDFSMNFSKIFLSDEFSITSSVLNITKNNRLVSIE